MSKYLPEVPFWWPYMALASVVWVALDWAFVMPGDPTYSVVFIFAYGTGARCGYDRGKVTL